MFAFKIPCKVSNTYSGNIIMHLYTFLKISKLSRVFFCHYRSFIYYNYIHSSYFISGFGAGIIYTPICCHSIWARVIGAYDILASLSRRIASGRIIYVTTYN